MIFHFDQYSLDTETVELTAGSVAVELEPQTFLLLQFLIENRDRVVSKDEIFETVWEGRIVADSTLAFAVNAARRAVGDDGKAQAVIRTFPRRGFRFVAPVVEAQAEEAIKEAGSDDPLTPPRKAHTPSDKAPKGMVATRLVAARRWRKPAIALAVLVGIAAAGLVVWQPWEPTMNLPSVENTTTPIDDRPSVAVLPFQNLSDDQSQKYFADGIAEDLITDLSKISGLLVIARNSSFRYRDRSVDVVQVGQELNVQYVLEGSVRRAEDRVRMNVQLVDAKTGSEIWTERYDGSLNDVFALQDQVTGRIIEALSLTLKADEAAQLADYGTTNIAAHDAFLRGQVLSRRHTPEGVAQAIAHYKQALHLDPDYSRAAAELSQVLYKVWRNYWVQTAALAGFAGGGETGVTRALSEAKGYAQKALENPTPAAHIAQALLLQPGRRYDKAIDHAQKAITLDPNDAAGYLGLAYFLVFAGEPERAIAHFEIARRLDPHNREEIDRGLGLAYFGMDRFDVAVRYFESARNAAPGNNVNWLYLAATYAHLGRRDDAEAAVVKMNALRRARGMDSFRTGYVFNWYFKNTDDENRLKEGLVKAGVPTDF